MAIAAHANRRDANEPEIVRHLHAVGATVLKISQRNAPDLLVGFRGVNHLLEIKRGKGKLRDGQETFRATWLGGPVHVVRTPDEALAVLGISLCR